jgi:uncharacterized protein
MRSSQDAFHVAIPTFDLDAAVGFYVGQLGAKLARRYPDRVTFDFFGDQLVCHLSETVPAEPVAYPRHFGVTFANGDDFDRLLRLVELRKVPTLGEAAVRFGGTAEEHRQIFLVDPSNNVLEFKVYDDPRLLY